jgi:hypothetical protein
MPPVAAPVDKKPLLAYDPPRWLDEPTYSSSSVQQQPFAVASPLQQPNNDQFTTISSNSADNGATDSRPVDPFVIISNTLFFVHIFLHRAVPKMLVYTRVSNLVLSIGMIVASLLSLLTTQSATTGVLACYVVVFSCLLCCFETHLKQVSVTVIICHSHSFSYSLTQLTYSLTQLTGLLSYSLTCSLTYSLIVNSLSFSNLLTHSLFTHLTKSLTHSLLTQLTHSLNFTNDEMMVMMINIFNIRVRS